MQTGGDPSKIIYSSSATPLATSRRGAAGQPCRFLQQSKINNHQSSILPSSSATPMATSRPTTAGQPYLFPSKIKIQHSSIDNSSSVTPMATSRPTTAGQSTASFKNHHSSLEYRSSRYPCRYSCLADAQGRANRKIARLGGLG